MIKVTEEVTKINTTEEITKLTVIEENNNINIIEEPLIIEVTEDVTEVIVPEEKIILEVYDNYINHPINEITSEIVYKAGEYLSGHRAIKIENNKAYYASNEIFSDKYKVIGISKGASIINEDCIITTYGEMSEPSWNWIEGLPIYLSSNGLLTQTVPVSNYILQIATVISSTKIFINIKIPLIIGGS